MRTTVDIEARVLQRAKRHSVESGQTLGALVSAALAAYLARPRSARSDPPFDVLVRGRPGGRWPTAEQIAEAEQGEEIAALRMPKRGRRASP